MVTPNMAASLRFHARCFSRRLFRVGKKKMDQNMQVYRLMITNSQNEYRETHFGYQNVAEEDKEKKVHDVFESVAAQYDLMNDAMSSGVHRLWKDRLLQVLDPSPGTNLLDVAGGTGDIAFRFLKYAYDQDEYTDYDLNLTEKPYGHATKECHDASNERYDEDYISDHKNNDSGFVKGQIKTSHVTVCDINQPMLNVGKKKAADHGYNTGITWLKGNAEHLPCASNTYDAYTISFGIRNVTHINKVLQEAHRVLKPGGRFLCLEFSRVNNPLLRSLYDAYSFEMIPVLGQVLAGDWKSYQYLVESIRRFPNQVDFAAMIKEANFKMVTFENLTFGVAAIHSGYKL